MGIARQRTHTLKLARTSRRLSVDELAAKASVGRATIYKLESGDVTNPSMSTARKLEAALGLSRGSLVFGHVDA